MAAILVFQNNKTVAMLVFQTNHIPVGVQKPGSWNLFFNMQTLSIVPINLHLAWENSRHFATPQLVSPRNSILITCYYPDLGSSSNWSVLWKEFASTNRKHYPDLGIDTSSVWNFSSRFSDFTSRGNQCCVAKCRLFCQANLYRDAVHVRAL